MTSSTRALAIGTVVLIGVAGCGGSDGKVKIVPVTGTVTFRGEPVTAASIYFMPNVAKGNDGKMATSTLQFDGSFTMETYPDGNGVLPGAYKVTFSLGRRPEKELDPYRTVEKTPLEIVVPDEGLRDLLIELK